MKTLGDERYVVVKAYKLTVWYFEIFLYCHILHVRAIPTLESTDSMTRCYLLHSGEHWPCSMISFGSHQSHCSFLVRVFAALLIWWHSEALNFWPEKGDCCISYNTNILLVNCIHGFSLYIAWRLVCDHWCSSV